MDRQASQPRQVLLVLKHQCLQRLRNPRNPQVVVGTLHEVNSETGNITVHSSDGVKHQIRVADHTSVEHFHEKNESGKGIKALSAKTEKGVVRGVEKAEHATVKGIKTAARETEKGVHVAVHYVEKNGEKVASKVKGAWNQTVETSQGVVQKVAKSAKTVTVKIKDGTEEVYHTARRTRPSKWDIKLQIA